MRTVTCGCVRASTISPTQPYTRRDESKRSWGLCKITNGMNILMERPTRIRCLKRCNSSRQPNGSSKVSGQGNSHKGIRMDTEEPRRATINMFICIRVFQVHRFRHRRAMCITYLATRHSKTDIFISTRRILACRFHCPAATTPTMLKFKRRMMTDIHMSFEDLRNLQRNNAGEGRGIENFLAGIENVSGRMERMRQVIERCS